MLYFQDLEISSTSVIKFEKILELLQNSEDLEYERGKGLSILVYIEKLL